MPSPSVGNSDNDWDKTSKSHYFFTLGHYKEALETLQSIIQENSSNLSLEKNLTSNQSSNFLANSLPQQQTLLITEHNEAITDFFLKNQENSLELFQNLEKIRKKYWSSSSTEVNPQKLSTTAEKERESNFFFDDSLLIYNQCVILFKFEKFETCFSELKDLFHQRRQHLDDFLILRVCFLLFEIFFDFEPKNEAKFIESVFEYIQDRFKNFISLNMNLSLENLENMENKEKTLPQQQTTTKTTKLSSSEIQNLEKEEFQNADLDLNTTNNSNLMENVVKFSKFMNHFPVRRTKFLLLLFFAKWFYFQKKPLQQIQILLESATNWAANPEEIAILKNLQFKINIAEFLSQNKQKSNISIASSANSLSFPSNFEITSKLNKKFREIIDYNNDGIHFFIHKKHNMCKSSFEMAIKNLQELKNTISEISQNKIEQNAILDSKFQNFEHFQAYKSLENEFFNSFNFFQDRLKYNYGISQLVKGNYQESFKNLIQTLPSFFNKPLLWTRIGETIILENEKLQRQKKNEILQTFGQKKAEFVELQKQSFLLDLQQKNSNLNDAQNKFFETQKQEIVKQKNKILGWVLNEMVNQLKQNQIPYFMVSSEENQEKKTKKSENLSKDSNSLENSLKSCFSELELQTNETKEMSLELAKICFENALLLLEKQKLDIENSLKDWKSLNISFGVSSPQKQMTTTTTTSTSSQVSATQNINSSQNISNSLFSKEQEEHLSLLTSSLRTLNTLINATSLNLANICLNSDNFVLCLKYCLEIVGNSSPKDNETNSEQNISQNDTIITVKSICYSMECFFRIGKIDSSIQIFELPIVKSFFNKYLNLFVTKQQQQQQQQQQAPEYEDFEKTLFSSQESSNLGLTTEEKEIRELLIQLLFNGAMIFALKGKINESQICAMQLTNMITPESQTKFFFETLFTKFNIYLGNPKIGQTTANDNGMMFLERELLT